MLATNAYRSPILSALRLWWWWLTVRRQPVARQRQAAFRAYTGVPRRFAIPPERAHLYARAADESFGG